MNTKEFQNMILKTTDPSLISLKGTYRLWIPCLAEESGEVAKIFRKLEKENISLEDREKIVEEVGDVIVTCVLIAASSGISLEEILDNSIVKFMKRYGVEK